MLRWFWSLFESFEGDDHCERCDRCKCLEADLLEATADLRTAMDQVEHYAKKVAQQDLIIADFIRITSVDTAYMTQQ